MVIPHIPCYVYVIRCNTVSVSVYLLLLLRNLEILQFQNTIGGRAACFKVQFTNTKTICKIRLLLENSQHLF